VANVRTDGGEGQGKEDHRADVAKSALLAVGAFASGIATILVAAGTWGIPDPTICYALTVLGVIGVIAFTSAAVHVMRRQA
jgi:hypothetical protein